MSTGKRYQKLLPNCSSGYKKPQLSKWFAKGTAPGIDLHSALLSVSHAQMLREDIELQLFLVHGFTIKVAIQFLLGFDREF